MSYNRENYKKVKDAFAAKAAEAKSAAARRNEELRRKFPEIADIDRVLASTGVNILKAAQLGTEGLGERLEKLKAENSELRAARAEFLEKHGYPADYDKEKYECPLCEDTGTVNGAMCGCFKSALAGECVRSSGIGTLINTQSFDSFELSYYTGEDRKRAEGILASVRSFAYGFGNGARRNLLFLGNTGLGKTHLTTSAARIVIERGYDVVYDSAQNIFTDFENEKFHKKDDTDLTGRYFSCDLLIIDDLGTELITPFSVSCLYNLLNSRIISGGSMIINTNFRPEEIMKKYTDRVVSRLMGEFEVFPFSGKDIRAQKLGRKENQ